MQGLCDSLGSRARMIHVPRDEDVKEWAEVNQVVTLRLPGS